MPVKYLAIAISEDGFRINKGPLDDFLSKIPDENSFEETALERRVLERIYFQSSQGLLLRGDFFAKILRFLKRLNYQQNAIVKSKFQNPEMDTMEKAIIMPSCPNKSGNQTCLLSPPSGIEKNPYR